MADAPNTSVQDEKSRNDVLSRSTAGSSTAAGQARDGDIEPGKKQPEPENAPAQADFAKVKLAKPEGLQAEEAAYGPGGTIPANMVSSPGGLVPVSAVNDPEEALERTLTSSGRNRDDRKLSEDEVYGLSGAELRAIGTQRGYSPPDMAGTGTQRRVFLEAQGKDERFKGKK